VGGGATNSGGSSSNVSSVAFPVSYSSDSRYLQDHNGNPVPILGRAAWFLISLPTSGYQTFLNDTLSRGYNAIEMITMDHDPRGNNAPYDGAGNLPFLKRLDGGSWSGSLTYSNVNNEAPDFTTPNASYWASLDALIDSCNQSGILVFLFPAYAGYGGGNQGWMQEMVANGASRMQTYGAFLANRYKSRGNIVWMMGGDHIPTGTEAPSETGLRSGLDSVSGQSSLLHSAEWEGGYATQHLDFGSMTLNGVYSFSGDVNTNGRAAYGFTPTEPAFLLEEPYDQEGPDGTNVNSSATQPVRRFQWSGWLSTIGGYISGNGYVWPFTSVWQSHLDTQGSRDMARLNTFIKTIAWNQLVPSGLGGMKSLVTSGGGSSPSDASYVAAAATPTGTLLVAYVPPAHSGNITLDMTAMSGTSQANWFNPTTAAYTSIGTYPNTGTHVFAPPADNGTGFTDWVLVLSKQ